MTFVELAQAIDDQKAKVETAGKVVAEAQAAFESARAEYANATTNLAELFAQMQGMLGAPAKPVDDLKSLFLKGQAIAKGKI